MYICGYNVVYKKLIDILKDRASRVRRKAAAWLRGMNIEKINEGDYIVKKTYLVPRRTNAYCESESMFVCTYH